MPTSAKSLRAATGLNDIFAKLEWHISRERVTAFDSADPDTVRIRYRSDTHGTTRIVTADPLRLSSWIRNESAPGMSRGALLQRFIRLLDRKPAAPAAPVQLGLPFL